MHSITYFYPTFTDNDNLGTMGLDVTKLLKQVGFTGVLRGTDFGEVRP